MPPLGSDIENQHSSHGVVDEKGAEPQLSKHVENAKGERLTPESERKTENDTPSEEQEFRVTPSFVMTLISFSMAFVGSQMVPLLFLTLLTLIANDLNAGGKTLWLTTANIVGTGAAAPLVGPLADYFGRKPVCLAGILSSLIGMILCATTKNANGFIAGQAFAGVGVAVQELVTIAGVTELVPVSKRGLYICFVISGFIPFAPGTYYGQAIASYNWRWVAGFVAIWNAISFTIMAIFYRPPKRPDAPKYSFVEFVHHFDLPGCFLAISGLVCLLIAINWGGVNYKWGSAHVIGTMVVGIVLLIVFVLWELFVTKHPLFPRRLAKNTLAFIAINFNVCVAGINSISILIFWAIQSISIYGTDGIQTGINTLPIGFCILGGAMMSAVLISMFKGWVRTIITGFCVMQTVGIACMAIVDPHNINTCWAPLIIGLIGIGGVLIPNQIVVTILAPDDLIATATALTVTLRSVGQSIGIAIYYNNFVSTLTRNAYKYIVPACIKLGIYNPKVITALVTGLTGTPLHKYVEIIPQVNTPQKLEMLNQAVIKCFGETMPIIWHISIAFGVAAIVACLFIGHTKQYMDNHIAVSYR